MTSGRWIIDEETAQALLEHARDPVHLFSQSPEDREMLISDAVAGKSEHQREELAQIVGRYGTSISQMSAALMAHVGIDPIFVAAATNLSGEITITRSDDDDLVHLSWAKNSKKQEGFVRLSKEVVWFQNGTMSIAGLPETVRAVIKGKCLRDLIDHPVLNTMDKNIVGTRTEVWGSTTYVHIDVGYHGVGMKAGSIMPYLPKQRNQ